MHEKQKTFKPPPKKYQPKGISILYEDRDLLVADKTNGLLSISRDQAGDQSAYSRLTAYVRKGNPKSNKRIYIVHRLDRDTSGLLVFAKSEEVKSFLQESWADFKKTYFAVVCGTPKKKEDLITSYLTENAAHRMYSIADPAKGMLAKTRYRVIKESPSYSLLEVDLLTGRKNQIRVHLADIGHPVAGDEKYGAKALGVRRLMLHAFSLTLLHPFSKESMTFESKVPGSFDALVMQRSR